MAGPVVKKFLDHEAALVVMADKMAEVKPRLRGWLHAGSVPFVIAAGVVLIVLSPSTGTKVGAGVFSGSALLLFGVSAIYHRGTWQPAVWSLLRRLDHSNIFILIAGTYTAFAMLLLQGDARVHLLFGIWSGALLGVIFRIFWTGAPRWLYTPIYIGLGWFAVFFIPDFVEGAGRLSTPQPCRWSCCSWSAVSSTPSVASSTDSGGRIPVPRGSASTRSSMPSRSWPSSRTTWRSRWRRTPCTDLSLRSR